MQTLANIEIANIVRSNEGLTIKIPNRLKTSAPKRCQPSLILPFYKEANICVARTLGSYLEKSNNIRTASTDILFITFKKPYHTATSQTISRWIKTVLGKSGLDTSIFTAHSTRHAATSAAARKGVNIDLIRSSASWSSCSKTFAKFYNRPLAGGSKFLSAILNTQVNTL